jgi:ferredoxin
MPKALILLPNGEEKEFEITEGEPVYDGVEKHGLKLPHGCLAGSCGTCRCIVHEGNENLSKKGAVEENTVEHIIQKYEEKYGKDFFKGKQVRLVCRAKIFGDVKLEPIKEKI